MISGMIHFNKFGFGNNHRHSDSDKIIRVIKECRFKKTIDEIRRVRDKKKRSKVKYLRLPGFLLGSVYSDGVPKGKQSNMVKDRWKKNVGGSVLDFDCLSKQKMNELRTFFFTKPYTMFMFRSPSGKGLKVGVKHAPSDTPSEFKLIKKRLFRSLPEDIRSLVDPACINNPYMQCFISADKEAFLNENPEPMDLVEIEDKPVMRSGFSNFIQNRRALSVEGQEAALLAIRELLEKRAIIIEDYSDYYLALCVFTLYDALDEWVKLMETVDKSHYHNDNYEKFDDPNIYYEKFWVDQSKRTAVELENTSDIRDLFIYNIRSLRRLVDEEAELSFKTRNEIGLPLDFESDLW